MSVLPPPDAEMLGAPPAPPTMSAGVKQPRMNPWASYVASLKNNGDFQSKYGQAVKDYNAEKKAKGEAQTGFFHYAKQYAQETGSFKFDSPEERAAKAAARKSAFLGAQKSMSKEERNAKRRAKNAEKAEKKGKKPRAPRGSVKKPKLADPTNCDIVRNFKAKAKEVAAKAQRDLLLQLRRSVPELVTEKNGNLRLKSLKCARVLSRPVPKKAKEGYIKPKPKKAKEGYIAPKKVKDLVSGAKRKKSAVAGKVAPNKSLKATLLGMSRTKRPMKGRGKASYGKKEATITKKQAKAMQKLLVQLQGGLGN